MFKTVLKATALAAALLSAAGAQADAITDWNERSAKFVADARIGTPPAMRAMAIVQTAAHEALLDLQRQPGAWSDAAAEAAIAGAHRVTLGTLLPTQKAAVDAAVQALAPSADAAAIGEKAAQRVLAARADDVPRGADSYRPHTTAGRYVPTMTPAVTAWPQRKPWLMDRQDQFRPGPPPALSSFQWENDYVEVKLMGAKDSKLRSAEQTAVAKFWDYSLPAIYHGVVRSVAKQPGRDLMSNARLFAAVAQSMDDAMIAVFDAKYTYNFWRPVTAIRNADIDGHDKTELDPSWQPLIDVPMHPEYPSGHSILAAAMSAVLEAELRGAQPPVLSTSSPTGNPSTRQWSSLQDLVKEVGDARVLAGIHYRTAVDVGAAMGREVGRLAAARLLAPPQVAQVAP